MKFSLTKTGFVPAYHVLVAVCLALTLLSVLHPPLVLVPLTLLGMAVLLLLGRFNLYVGPWGNRPVWSMNRHRTNVLLFWRLYKESAGCSREVMRAMLAAQLRAKGKPQ